MIRLTSSRTINSHRIPSLDGLRTVSISLVVLSHLLPSLHLPLPSSVLATFSLGGLGVRIFFVISGFLITNLLLQELARSQQINLIRFYFQRTLRIFPAYYCFLIVLKIFHIYGLVNLGSHDLLHAVTYTTNYCRNCTWAVGHTWSLSIEEQFYLLWPIALFLLGRRRGLYIAVLLMLLCPFVRLIYLNISVYNSGYPFEAAADSLAAGCLLAAIYKRLETQTAYMRWQQSSLFFIAPLIVLLIELLATRPSLMPTSTYLLVGISIQILLIVLCIHHSILYTKTTIGRLLNAKPIAFIGTLSYSIYLWQQIFLNPFAEIVKFPFNFTVIILVSLMSYFIIEQPFLKLRRIIDSRIFGVKYIEITNAHSGLST